MTRPVHLPACVAGALSLGPGLPGPARAQEAGGPVVVGERERLGGVELERLDAAVNLFGQWREDEQRTSGEPDRTDYEQLLRADLELSGRAFVGHRNLLDLTGSVRLGLEDLDIDSDTLGQSRRDVSSLYLFDVNGLFFAESLAPTSLFARRQRTLLDREFAGSIESTNTEYGVQTRFRSGLAPVFIEYRHRELEQDDRLGTGDFSVEEDSLTLRSHMRLTDTQELGIEYTFESVTETRTAAFRNSFDRHDLLVTHTLRFGPEDRHSLHSQGRYFDQSGQFAFRRLRLDERLRLQHTDNFETIYDLTLEDQDRRLESQQLVRGVATARHQLFESLVTTASVGASRTEVPDVFVSDQVFTDLNLSYTKTVPYGLVEAAAGVGLDRRDDSERGQPVDIVDQQLVFPDAGPAVIGANNVVPGSVVVKDAAGLRVFQEGVDYTVLELPDRVELRRIVGGAIGAGETVLVDYTIGPQPASTLDTVSTTAALRYTAQEGLLAGLSPYVNYQRLDRSLETEAPELFFVDDVRDLTYGLEYRIGPFDFLAERQHRDSRFSPFDATRLEARYNQRLGYASSLTVNLNHEIIDFPDDDDRLRLNRAILRWFGRLGEDVDFGLTLLYRDEDSRRFGESTGLEQAIELNWRRGQTAATVALRNATLDAERESNQTQTLRLNFRREF